MGGALVMCVGAALLRDRVLHGSSGGAFDRGVWAALGAGVLWGTMYISVP